MLGEIAAEMNAGVIMLTESHLNKDIIDAEVKISGFDIYRTDRINFKNGGVAIFIRTELNLGVKTLLSLSHNKIEVLEGVFEN